MRAAKNLMEEEENIQDNGSDTIEERKELIEDLFEKAEQYVKTNIELAKLKVIDKVADTIGALVTQIALVLVGFFSFFVGFPVFFLRDDFIIVQNEVIDIVINSLKRCSAVKNKC